MHALNLGQLSTSIVCFFAFRNLICSRRNRRKDAGNCHDKLKQTDIKWTTHWRNAL